MSVEAHSYFYEVHHSKDLKTCYDIHPNVIKIKYEDIWGTYFQHMGMGM